MGFANPIAQLPLLVLFYPATLTFFALKAAGARQAFANGFFTGLAGCTASLYWIAIPVHDFGYFPWAAALPFPFLLGAYVALYAGLFCFIVYKLKRWLWPDLGTPPAPLTLLRLLLLCICVWTLLEYLRGYLFTGFPWLTLSAAFMPWPFAVQGLSAIGSYALSGLYAGFAAGAVLLFLAIQQLPKAKILNQIMPCALFLAAALSALALWTSYAMTPKGDSSLALGVILVQGNINQDQKWNPAYQQATFAHYEKLSLTALNNLKTSAATFAQIESTATSKYVPDLKLLVWPETALPLFYQTPNPIAEALRKLAREQGINILFGAPGYEPVAGVKFDDYPLFNRAYLVNAAGEDVAFYDKEHLVPFGEYAPPFLRLPILEFLLAQVGNFEPGKRVAPLQSNGISLGVLICYETIFQELARKRVANGANIFINISNDAWFGRSAAPEQHLQLSMQRAVEEGRWLVRATNTGISTVVDPFGKRLIESQLFTSEVITTLAYARSSKTMFFHIEPFIPYVIMLISALLLLPEYLRPRRPTTLNPENK